LLGVPHVGSVDLYQLDDRKATWIARWKEEGEEIEEL